ncbi:LysR substrate-binding domain-containing protein [Ramlibacter sp.]|uniref:LysR substrate-binding domain-containing protein n=1 Tax=Ramlibacter sp. TaxID=1917967 RepID=UPI001808C415|nr:LysR substrate-binding domain-containing protein [Ramlibacter sp.]MBA2672448.1 LysR family transcriptional regulator [Ramlibacter sp.]
MSLPLVRLPSLDLIKGFVAVSRRMSITQAAEDLCLTQSAMSKQVRALEQALGVRLFHRGYRSVSLTEAGERLFQSANAAVQQLQDAMGSFSSGGKRPVTITASAGVAGLWLLPRLGDFQRRHPEVDVRFATNNAVVDLASEQIDLAVRYCAESQAPKGAVKLFGETVAPVAHPSLGLSTLDSKQALARQVLLEFDVVGRPWLHWADWLAARGWRTAQAKGVVHFNQYDQMIQAAVAGQGVALGRLELLTPLIDEGRLTVVQAAAGGEGSHHAYWLVQADREPRRDVSCVVEWILDSAQARLNEA